MDHHESEKLFNEFPPVSTSQWEERIIADLKGGDYQKRLIWKTDEGFDVKPYYRKEDLENLQHVKTLPDQPPFVRGNHKSGNDWLLREDICETSVPEINSRALELVSKGVTSLGLKAMDVSTHKQMSQLLTGIDLLNTPVNFIASQSYPLTLELFIYELVNRSADHRAIRGSLNFDPIGYLLLHGDFYSTWAQNLEETEYIVQTIHSKLPRFKAITVNGHYFQDAGSTLVQELAFTIASACEYLAGVTEKGIPVDRVAPYIQLSMATGPSYFLEIAKLRAARILWNRMVGQFHPVTAPSGRVFIHATTARWNKSVIDPYVNMLRTTTEGMSAILGNADSVSVLPFDISFASPAAFSARIARNQQLLLKEEAYLDKVADPAAGSYYIEKLTDSMAFHAWELFRKVEAGGGILAAFQSGFIQEEIRRSREKKEADVAQRRMILLGTNQYPNIQEDIKVSSEDQKTRHEPTEASFLPLTPFRAAASFEEVRFATERHVNAGNARPGVFLFTMGNLAMLRARAGFASNFFGCAGFEIIDNQGFSSVEEGIAAALESGAPLVVICSSDEEYSTLVPVITPGLKNIRPDIKVIVAGYPKDEIELFRNAGVDAFIHIRSNLLETLKEFQRDLGIFIHK